MKHILLSIALCISCTAAFCQNIKVDIKRDWYAEVPTVKIDNIDTIVLMVADGSMIRKSDVIAWHYDGDDDFQLLVYNNTQPGFSGAFKYPEEQWSLKQNGIEYELHMKQYNGSRPARKDVATYHLIPFYTDHGLLNKMMLIREYSDRLEQDVTKPPFIK